MKGVEVLAGQRRGEQSAKCFSSATFRPHRRSHRVHLAESLERAGHAALVARPGPCLTLRLSWQRSNCPFVLESVPVLVGTLPAYLVAIEPRPARPANDGELFGAECTCAMRGLLMLDDWHGVRSNSGV